MAQNRLLANRIADALNNPNDSLPRVQKDGQTAIELIKSAVKNCPRRRPESLDKEIERVTQRYLNTLNNKRNRSKTERQVKHFVKCFRDKVLRAMVDKYGPDLVDLYNDSDKIRSLVLDAIRNIAESDEQTLSDVVGVFALQKYGFQVVEMQHWIYQWLLNDEPSCLIKSITGSGKTMALLAAILAMPRGTVVCISPASHKALDGMHADFVRHGTFVATAKADGSYCQTFNGIEYDFPSFQALADFVADKKRNNLRRNDTGPTLKFKQSMAKNLEIAVRALFNHDGSQNKARQELKNKRSKVATNMLRWKVVQDIAASLDSSTIPSCSKALQALIRTMYLASQNATKASGSKGRRKNGDFAAAGFALPQVVLINPELRANRLWLTQNEITVALKLRAGQVKFVVDDFNGRANDLVDPQLMINGEPLLTTATEQQQSKCRAVEWATVESARATVESAPAAVESARATVESAPAAVESARATVESAPAAVESARATVESAPAAVVLDDWDCDDWESMLDNESVPPQL